MDFACTGESTLLLLLHLDGFISVLSHKQQKNKKKTKIGLFFFADHLEAGLLENKAMFILNKNSLWTGVQFMLFVSYIFKNGELFQFP